MSSRDVVCRYGLRAVGTLVVGAALLLPAGLAAARDPVASQPGFDAFVQAWSTDAGPASETAEQPATEVGSPPPETRGASAPTAPLDTRQAAPAGDSGETLLSRAAPILLAFLGVAIVLLGLAALPPTRRKASALSVLVAERRLEIGLIGGAALASAAIGLAVAATAG